VDAARPLLGGQVFSRGLHFDQVCAEQRGSTAARAAAVYLKYMSALRRIKERFVKEENCIADDDMSRLLKVTTENE
jgi:hypothetical protein